MKRKVLLSALMIFILLPVSFAQDNIYGDYFMGASQKLISLDLEGANLGDVLKMLSQQTGLNFIATEAVRERRLTLYLENTPLKEAMDIIFKANNLTYDYYPDANMFVVKEMGKPAIELRTKVYHLKYTRIKTSVMQKEIEDKMRSTTSGTESSSGTGTGGSEEEDKGLLDVLKKVVTEFGKVTEDPITNSLIVTDVPSQFATIDELVANLDIPAPKVMIEVEMLDVNKSLADKIGISWGTDGLFISYVPPAFQTTFPFPTSFVKTIPTGNAPNVQQRMISGAVGTTQFGTLSLQDMTIALQLLSTDTTTRFLARPKILTLSDETAEVNLTTDEAIGVTTSVAAGGAGTSTQTVERTETGTKLRVTPHVNPYTKEVTMFVEIFNRQATDTTIRLAGMTTGVVKNPEERGTRSVTRLKDGETLLIGGLIHDNDSNTVAKVPFFGDIPIIGNAFRHKSTTNAKRELLVFLTPHIVDDSHGLAKREVYAAREQDSFQRESMRMAMDRYSREN
ncbi:MAG: secretin N-terminal domain-containing protein [Candidatus Omnitrophica bacterium]|nr:secretin N-terminal domain-containing protein [Candidatus Omnitrophota bacterium]